MPRENLMLENDKYHHKLQETAPYGQRRPYARIRETRRPRIWLVLLIIGLILLLVSTIQWMRLPPSPKSDPAAGTTQSQTQVTQIVIQQYLLVMLLLTQV